MTNTLVPTGVISSYSSLKLLRLKKNPKVFADRDDW